MIANKAREKIKLEKSENIYKRKMHLGYKIFNLIILAMLLICTIFFGEYTIVKSDFDNGTNNISSVETSDARTSIEVAGIETGHDYFFRVRAINDYGESNPTDVVMIPIGTPPAAPTTWSSATSAFVGDEMDLNWTHNPTDNSRQSYAQLSLKINDNDWISYTFENTTNETTGDRTDTDTFTYAKIESLGIEVSNAYLVKENVKYEGKDRLEDYK